MKKVVKLFCIVVVALFFATASVPSSQAQSAGQLLINEVEIDPPSSTSDDCQYVEILGQNPGGVVPANTWFITVDNSNSNPGNVAFAANLGGTIVGSNGTITLLNSAGPACPNRVFPPGTTVVQTSQPLGLGFFSSRAFLLLTSNTPFSLGQNVDANQNGEFDFPVTVIDGFAFNVNPKEEFNYGGTPQIYAPSTGETDIPDAVTRFPGRNTPLSATAFYFGELASSPDETTAYTDPRSSNFPAGGALTPGSPNVPVAPADAPVDLNGDGKTDYVVVRSGGVGTQLTWLTQFNGGSPSAAREWGINGDQPISGDYDGDGIDDIAVYRPSNSTFYILNSGSLTIRVEQFGQAGDNPRVVGDFDGDGRDDLALYRSGTQSLWFYKTSSSALFNTVEWGAAGDTPAPGDYDGDGRADFAVRRASGANGIFWLRTASGTFSTVPFGLASDLVTPGDYDDDGRTDFAVVRTDGPFYVWDFEPSGTAGNTIVSDTWGVAGDVIVQGDYDGDGRTDYAVWRPGTPSTFYMMTVGTRNIFTKVWGQAGDVPVAAFNTF